MIGDEFRLSADQIRPLTVYVVFVLHPPEAVGKHIIYTTLFAI